MAERFAGKRVFITGASSGIGAALAVELAEEGARIALGARRADRLNETCQLVKEAGGEAVVTPCDVRDRASVDEAVGKATEALGGLDLAVANAGFGVNGPFDSLKTEDFRRQFDTNLFGVIDTIYAVLPHLEASKGHLAVVSSVLGRVGSPLSSAYCASKFALCGLCEVLYYELRGKGISVTCIEPGVIESEIRSVDNRGRFHPRHKDPAPEWLRVPAEQAAREIASALYARKYEAVITGHGKAVAFVARHFPRTWRFIGRTMVARRDVMGRARRPK
jgi:NAD(P)-dependent dehydrogenase (short-subunit alcohol dehydrogenase family)